MVTFESLQWALEIYSENDDYRQFYANAQMTSIMRWYDQVWDDWNDLVDIHITQSRLIGSALNAKDNPPP